MDKITLIKAEIERLYDGEAPKHDQQCDFSDGYFTGLSVISNFLDTLSEEPDKSREEAAEEYTQKMLESWRFDSTGCRPLREPFIAGAEWQKSQMLKDAVEVTVQSPILGPPMVCCIASGCSDGDKVRIVVLKAEEE